MGLSTVINLNITRATSFPTRAGFGVPLIVAFHARPNVLDFYSAAADAVSDGHDPKGAVVAMLTKGFSQPTKPKVIAVGKRAVGTTMVVTLLAKITTQGKKYEFDFIDYLGVITHVSFTCGASETATTIGAAIAAQLSGIAGAAAVAATGTVTITGSTAGRLFDLANLPPLDQLTVKNTSADPGIATDLAAIYALDSSTWYGIGLDSNSKAELLAAAAWVEATRKLMVAQSSDSEICDNAVTNDVSSAIKAAGYARTQDPIVCQDRVRGYRAFGLMCKMFTTVPGKSTWEYQTIASDTVDGGLTDGNELKAWAKNASTYRDLGGVHGTRNVKLGDGEWVDLVPGTDKLFARIQEGALAILANASNTGQKIPYSNAGVAVFVAMIKGQLDQATKDGFLSAERAYTVTAPLVEDVDPAERANRNVPDITFQAYLAGAIHTLDPVTGVLSV